MKPFLRWAGSKKRLLPELKKHWNTDRSKGYIEPFVGSAQLLFSLSPTRAIIGDINEELTITYQQIKSKPDEISSILQGFELGKESYYYLRALKVSELSRPFRAARFIFLNRFCFNGLYRTNLKGEFNVPFAGSRTGNLPSAADLRLVSKSLRNTIVNKGDFEEVVRNNIRNDDFVYFDPPYAVSNTRIFHQYNAQNFGLSDLKRLSALLDDLNDNGNKFLLSYAKCPEAYEIFSNWEKRTVSTQRFMKGFGKDRKKAEELLIYN